MKTQCLTENLCHMHWLTCCIDSHNWMSVWRLSADKVTELESGLHCLTLLLFPWGSIKDTLTDVHGTFSNSKMKPTVAVRSLRCSCVECCNWHFLLSTLVWLVRTCLQTNMPDFLQQTLWSDLNCHCIQLDTCVCVCHVLMFAVWGAACAWTVTC